MSQSILRARGALAILALAGAAFGVQAQTQAQPTTPSATPGAGAGANSSGTGTAAGQSPAAGNQGAVQAAFKRADSNADGKLAPEELGVFPSLKLTDLDKNKDGFVSADEFDAGVSARTN